MDKKSLLVLLVMLLTVMIAAGFVAYVYVMEPAPEAPTSEPYRATISGEQVCLPHKDTSGPVTLECAIGLKTDTGKYYALDYGFMSETIPTVEDGQRFTANGLITPIENLSTDHWQKYDVVGIFSVTDGVVVEPPRVIKEEPIVVPAPPPEPLATTTASTSLDVAVKCYVGGCSSQLCTSDPDAVSDCMYREEYTCYQGATCAVQADGQCGWTETEDLLSCLDASDTEVTPAQ